MSVWEHALGTHGFLIATDPNLHILKLQILLQLELKLLSP